MAGDLTFQMTGSGPGNQALDAYLGDVEVTHVRFFVKGDSSRVEVVQVTTEPDYQRRGYGTAALRHLDEAFPEHHLLMSPDEQNSDEGKRLIASARREGVRLHPFGCHWVEGGCTCGLDNA